MLGLLGMAGAEDDLVARLLDLHTELVADSYLLPAAYPAVLQRVAQRHRLALFSNFDYAPALRRLLGQHGLDRLFDPIVISAEIGFRKPGRKAFELALAPIPHPRETVLFVGDSLVDDVAGAAGAGLTVAWINAAGAAPASGAATGPRPDFVIRDLTQLEALLEG
jgi:putative hydrolase of the HAD superfamily